MTEWSDIESLSGKDRKTLISKAETLVKDPGSWIPKKGKTLRFTDPKGNRVYVVDNKTAIFIEIKGVVVPSLRIVKKAEIIVPKIVVDKGAIRFVTKGADIMRPGITKIDEDVLEGQIVLIVEETNGAALSFGIALYDSVDMKQMTSGKCITNVHHLGDEWWDFTR